MSRRVVPDEEPIWRALADPTRRAILDALRSGPQTTGDLAAAFPTTRFTVMEHLSVLGDVGLVTVERRGRTRLNHLNPVPLQQVHERWVRPQAAAAADALLRLTDHLEDEMTDTTTRYDIDVRAEHVVDRDVATTWRALLELTRWWNPCWDDHERLIFEPRPGGRLGVSAGPDLDDQGRLWGHVSELAPRRALAVDGSMGLPGAVAGHWRMSLEPEGSRTRVRVVHQVLGHVSDTDRAGFTSGWTRTLVGLAAHAGIDR